MMTSTMRTSASPWRLLAETAGPPRELAGKLRRLRVALRRYGDGPELERRLARLVERGYLAADAVPTRLQLVVGAIDMLRFWISPAAAQYYQSKGIHYGFHQLLRVLDDPASMVDPTGLMSDEDVIIGHVMQVVHANPCYDLQLLEAHPRGVAELERQVRAMLDGSHPRAASIGAIVEEPDYHARLLDYVAAYRADPTAAAAPVRQNVSADPHWGPIERTFGTLPSTLRYFARMPRTLPEALEHLRRVTRFPAHLGEPAPIALRDLGPEDELLLWRMLALAAHVPADRDVRRDAATDPRLAAYAEGWGRAGDRGVVAEAGGVAVGAAWVRRWSDEHHGYVRREDLPELAIAVAPDHRGRGVGGMLLDALLERVPEGMVLSVRRDNPAVRLYERKGFVTVDEMPNRAGGTSLVMARPATG